MPVGDEGARDGTKEAAPPTMQKEKNMIELDLPYPLMDQGNDSTPKEMVDCDIKKYLLANQDQTINWRADLCLDWDHVARAFYPSDENLARERRLMEIAYEDKENFDPKELRDIMMFYLKTFYPNSEFLKPSGRNICPPVNTKKNRHSIHWSLMDLIGTMVVYGELLTQGKTTFEHDDNSKPTVRECTPEYLEKVYWRMLVDMRWIMDCLHFPDVKLGKRWKGI